MVIMSASQAEDASSILAICSINSIKEIKMKQYFRIVYTSKNQQSLRDAIVGLDNLSSKTPVSSFKDEIAKVVEEQPNISDVHIYQVWDMGTEVDFINV